MQRQHQMVAVGRGVVVAVVIVILVIAGAAGYFLISSGGPSTSTSSSTTSSLSTSQNSFQQSTSTAAISSNPFPTTNASSSSSGTASLSSSSGSSSASSSPSSTSQGTTNSTFGFSSTLINAAKNEGSITFYGDIDQGPFMQSIWGGFQKDFPWAQVNYLVVFGSQVTGKVSAEYQSHHVIGDIIDGAACISLNNQFPGILLSWNNPSMQGMGYPSNDYSTTDGWYPYILAGPILLAYNTQLISASQVPKSYQNLSLPQYGGGKIALNNPSSFGLVSAFYAMLYAQLGNATADQITKGIAANHPTITPDIGSVFNDVSTGQNSLGFIDTSDYVSANGSAKANIAIDYISPVAYRQNPTCIMSGSPHPNLAKLFAEWAVTDAGQQAINAAGRPPVLPSLFSQHMTQIVGVPSNIALDPTPVGFLQNPTPWLTYWKNMYGL